MRRRCLVLLLMHARVHNCVGLPREFGNMVDLKADLRGLRSVLT